MRKIIFWYKISEFLLGFYYFYFYFYFLPLKMPPSGTCRPGRIAPPAPPPPLLRHCSLSDWLQKCVVVAFCCCCFTAFSRRWHRSWIYGLRCVVSTPNEREYQ